MADYDLFSNIAIIKSEGKTKKQKLKQAQEILKKPGIKSVYEKASNVKGRLRTIDAKWIAGKKNLIADYKENGCLFKFNISTCYFSSRLANERQKISSMIKMKDRVLVMFAGVGVYPIVLYKYKKPSKIVGVEIGKDCCKWFKENLNLNKIPKGKIEIVQGDVKRVIPKLIKGKYNFGNAQNFFQKNFGAFKTKREKSFEGFDVVIMARPNLKESFLKWGLMACRRGSLLIYYGFCKDDKVKKLTEDLVKEACNYRRKIKINKIVQAGEIAPYKHRWRVEMNVEN